MNSVRVVRIVLALLAPVLVLVLLPAPAARAQEPSAAEAAQAMGKVSSSARQELERSLQALSELRDRIAAEKLPLAEELTALEDQLALLRKDHDSVTRLIDASNLELPTIKAEMKARQDELDYVGNLLDEYARTFEAKVNVSELQYCGESVTTAKEATENTTLTAAERFTRQLDFVTVSLKRLDEAVGGMRFPGVGVDQQGTVVDGDFALIGPVALFRAQSGLAGLVIPQTGSTKPLIRPLEGPMQVGLGTLVATGEGTLPLDPTRGAALKALVQKTNLIHIFEKGGPIMWPLLFASVLALGSVLERVVFLLNEKRKRDPRAVENLFVEVQRGDLGRAILIGKASKDYVARSLTYALEHREKSLPNALLYAQAQELKRFQRGISVLDTVITLAPLLGLLGTVTGMMGSFSLIGGDLSAPGAITGGIAEALIATAFGLGIAITALLPFNVLNTKLETAQHEIESAGAQLELILHPQSQQQAVVALPGHSSHDLPGAQLVGAGRS